MDSLKFSDCLLLHNFLKNYFPDLSADENSYEQAYLWALKLNHKHFRKKLKEYRENCGYSQTSISKVLNVTQATYSSWETGKHIPKVEFIKKLSGLYKVVDPVYFLVSKKDNVFSAPSSILILPSKFFEGLKVEEFNEKKESALSSPFFDPCVHTLEDINSHFKQFNFAFLVEDNSMQGVREGIPQGSYALCNFKKLEGKSKEEILRLAHEQVVIMTYKHSKALVRQVFFNAADNLVTVKTWNMSNYLNKVLPNTKQNRILNADNFTQTVPADDVEIFGIVLSYYGKIADL